MRDIVRFDQRRARCTASLTEVSPSLVSLHRVGRRLRPSTIPMLRRQRSPSGLLAARITMSVGTRTITLQVANPTLKACSTLASILQRKLGDEAPPCSSRFRFLWAPTLFDDDTTLRELTSPLAALGLGHEALLTLSCLRRRYLSARAPLRRETLVSVGKRPQMGRQGGCCDFKHTL